MNILHLVLEEDDFENDASINFICNDKKRKDVQQAQENIKKDKGNLRSIRNS